MNYLLRLNLLASITLLLVVGQVVPVRAYLTGVSDDTDDYEYSQSGSGDTDAPEYRWIDLSTTGVEFDSSRSKYLGADLGLDTQFSYQGIAITDIGTYPQGIVAFTGTDETTGNAVVFYIFGLYTSGFTGGKAYAAVQDGKIIIQYQDVYHSKDTNKSNPGSFEYVMDTSTNVISISYKNVPYANIAEGEEKRFYQVGLEFVKYSGLTSSDEYNELFTYYSNTAAGIPPLAYANTTVVFYPDVDEDGVYYNRDCDDSDASIVTADTATWYADADSDGLGDAAVSTTECVGITPTGYVSNSSDSNDSDADNDGVVTSADCNDADSTISVAQTYYMDADQDGYGNPAASEAFCQSTPPATYATNADDLDDNDPNSNDDTDPCVTATAGERTAQTCVTATSTTIATVSGTTQGITVTYADASTQTFVVFKKTAPRTAQAKLMTGNWITVVNGKGTKLAVVNGMTGEVQSRAKLAKKPFPKRRLQVANMKVDGNSAMTIVFAGSAPKRSAGRVVAVKVNTTTGAIVKKASAKITQALKVKKTKLNTTKNTIRVTTKSADRLRYTLLKGWKLKIT